MLRVAAAPIAPGDFVLDADASHYVARVHRARIGDRLILFDPEACVEAEAEVRDVMRGAVRCHVGRLRPAAVRAERAITVVQALAKGEKIDAIVRDATELGARRVIVTRTARSVLRFTGADGAARRARWQRIAVEAARQSGRGDVPEVVGPLDWPEALDACRSSRASDPSEPPGTPAGSAAGSGLCVCFYEQATAPFGPMLSSARPAAPVTVAIGPEGGFEPAEIDRAAAAGFAIASLGPFVLRTETVAAAVLGAILVFGAIAEARGENRTMLGDRRGKPSATAGEALLV